ncbi:MAG: hypothetical protein Q4D98_01265 [Planctomycetia bacterium]|nr:hypothetical protein [Planctomycetia bacterium]
MRILHTCLLGCFLATCANAQLPENWQNDWDAPKKEHRPLQILHGWLKGWSTMHETHTWDFSTFTHPGDDSQPDRSPEDIRRIFEELGFGGVVCNVGGEEYFRDEKQWDLLVKSVRAFDQAGLRIWIYDEQGYPSLGAGGLVLEKRPELESLALVYDKDLEKEGKNPYYSRPAFEYTHAANNVRVLRRYPNPLEPEATQLFIQLTHEAYRQRLGEALFQKIEAFFTDEPSIIAFNLSNNPGAASLPSNQAKVDRTVKNLPMVPWSRDFAQAYQKAYQEDITKHFSSLFQGDSAEDIRIRRQFWKLVAKMDREFYYGQIQDYLKKQGSSCPTLENSDAPLRLAFSGHLLGEEDLLMHLRADGDKLACLARMDVPGLDVLAAAPARRRWLAPAMPCSAAFLTGKRLVMTEVSDMVETRFIQPRRIASVEEMCTQATWQGVWGVTEFTSYFRFENQGKEGFRKYGDFVGRVNAILRKAKPVRPVLLFYPIEEMQEHYLPGNTRKCQRQHQAFLALGGALVKNQIPFVIVNRSFLQQAQTLENGAIQIGGCQYDVLLVPQGSSYTHPTLPTFHDQAALAQIPKLREKFPRLETPQEEIVGGQFERDGKTIWMLGNMHTTETYTEKWLDPAGRKWLRLNPATGEITTLENHSVTLKPMETVLLVSE